MLDNLDLNDPETANAVADAIVRYHGGGYVPLSARYPWEFQSRTWQAIDQAELEATLLRNGPTTWDELDARVMAEHVLALLRSSQGGTDPWSGWTEWVPDVGSPFEFRWLRGTPRTESRPIADAS